VDEYDEVGRGVGVEIEMRKGLRKNERNGMKR
jgi:hypothetical protein